MKTVENPTLRHNKCNIYALNAIHEMSKVDVLASTRNHYWSDEWCSKSNSPTKPPNQDKNPKINPLTKPWNQA